MKLQPPTPWQQKTIYSAATALSIFVMFWVATYFFQVVVDALQKLQAFLIPMAIAAVLAYLLEPVVKKLCSWKLSRTSAVLIVFGVFFLSSTLIFFWVAPVLYDQAGTFWQKLSDSVPKARELIDSTIKRYQAKSSSNQYYQTITASVQTWFQNQLPDYTTSVWSFVRSSFGGALQIFGYIIGLLIVPLYLFYFLIEAALIEKKWSDYLPLRPSPFKDEVVDALTEINGYLIAFFRGQLVVSAIDGLLIGSGLIALELNFGILIGLLVAILGLVPYLGMLICWVPAVLIAVGQFGDWSHPLWVTAIFIGMNQLESWLIAPKIVGNSVGLHPLTVMASVIGWSLLLGGLLGAILAVPLTATLKVLLRRYVWHRKMSQVERKVLNTHGPSAVETVSE